MCRTFSRTPPPGATFSALHFFCRGRRIFSEAMKKKQGFWRFWGLCFALSARLGSCQWVLFMCGGSAPFFVIFLAYFCVFTGVVYSALCPFGLLYLGYFCDLVIDFLRFDGLRAAVSRIFFRSFLRVFTFYAGLFLRFWLFKR